jgi:hypothetical protein
MEQRSARDLHEAKQY